MKTFFEFSNKIIAESIGMDYCGTINHYDLFRSEQFQKDLGKGVFKPIDFIKIIDKKIKLNSYKKEVELLIYNSPCKNSIFINIKPEGTFRHQIVFERYHYNVNSIPHLTKTGQIRIILDENDFK